ncbi:hypothetical protein DL89DRAFT_257620 [Linderina pennispora]|uniref:C2H2-type domain-containing protein n=1 Tax=Linderina pennispora TaxID=61395 RepID=A0A1Y1W9Z6_9FUNG|nr:uncharacterized protein DL89DRAFT_257620 [Linderina pennispora]ORX70367.1 hypothetical protein DL89DRAFT_257620 [Linderina pennispora]
MDILEITDGSLMRDKQRTHHCTWGDCSKSFTRKSDLKRHYRIHTNEKPFSCHYAGCGKSFVQKSALTVHLRTHSGEKPHCCKEPGCGKRFSDSSSLARHRHTHSGKRTYQCSFAGCNKQFYSKGAYTNHHRMHMDTIKHTPRAECSPASTCPSTPHMASMFVGAQKQALDTRPIVHLGLAELPGVREHVVSDIVPSEQYVRPMGCDLPPPVFKESLKFPQSACRMVRSDTVSSFETDSVSPRTPSPSRFSPDQPQQLPSIHEHLGMGILSMTASVLPPMPVCGARSSLPFPNFHHHHHHRQSLPASAGVRYAPY